MYTTLLIMYFHQHNHLLALLINSKPFIFINSKLYPLILDANDVIILIIKFYIAYYTYTNSILYNLINLSQY